MFCFFLFFQVFFIENAFSNCLSAIVCLVDWAVCLMLRKIVWFKLTLEDRSLLSNASKIKFNNWLQLKMVRSGFEKECLSLFFNVDQID